MCTLSLTAALLVGALLVGASSSALAADSHAADAKAHTSASKGFDLPPFPADKQITQTTHVAGKTLKYTVTVGSLPVRDEKGKITANVMFTAYTMGGNHRPVTFALNGGPGASSVFLNLGAIGPKRISFGVEGDSPSNPAILHDNPGT
ncbi:MAG: peptidase S10, partial [Xanthomonadales bacterium]|nr:peptidase S10 [Xanthomonadales bacterium]